MNLFDVYPIEHINIERALGSFVWDNKGKRYLDMYGGHAVISVGHTHPHYVQRLTEQLHKIGFYSNSIRISQQQELAEKLGRISGREDYQLFLCNSGAEANENAFKLASFHNGRKKIVAFEKGFHGRTSLAVSASDNASIIAPVNQTDHITLLPFNDEAALDAYFAVHGDEISSVIVEGIQGVGGIRVASDSFLQTIRNLCDQYGAVFIADSVQCGYGRSGLFFSHDHAGISADIYTMAKGMGNGFPIGGIIIAPHIKPRHGMLGTTFGGNHLACTAALAVLEIIEQEDLMKNATKTGEHLTEQLGLIYGLHGVRGKGLMIGFDVPTEYTTLRKDLLHQHNIFTGEAKPNVIRLLPSLGFTTGEANMFMDAVRTAVSDKN